MLDAYERLVPSAPHPYWDVVDALDLLPFARETAALDGWPAGSHWWDDDPNARERLERFLTSALAQLG